MSNEVALLKNGWLDQYPFQQITETQLDGDIAALCAFKQYLDARKVKMLYVHVPYKNVGHDDLYPYQVHLNSLEMIDTFCSQMEKAGVDVLDFTPVWLQEGEENWYQRYFITDHHWKLETAFSAVADTMDHLRETCGFMTDPQFEDINQYTVSKYDHFFLGSYGKRVGKIFGGLDDFSLIIPKFETFFYTKDVLDPDRIHAGSFEDVFTKTIYLLEQGRKYVEARNFAYSGPDRAHLEIINDAAPNKQCVFLLKDSYALPYVPFLSLYFSEIHMFDLRYMNRTSDDLYPYIDQLKPDLVLFLHNTRAWSEPVFFDFGDAEKPYQERNYLLDSEITLSGDSKRAVAVADAFAYDALGKTVTLSIEALPGNSGGQTASDFSGIALSGVDKTGKDYRLALPFDSQVLASQKEWKRISVSAPYPSNLDHVWVEWGMDDQAGISAARNPKLEIGSVATDWTPANEDIGLYGINLLAENEECVNIPIEEASRFIDNPHFYDGFIPGRRYTLSVDRFADIKDKTQRVYILLYDFETNADLFVDSFFVRDGRSYEHTFQIPDDGNHYTLLITVGKCDTVADNTMILHGCGLFIQ